MGKQTQDDQVAIMQLKSELSKAWMMFDTANEKEQRLKEKCQQYKVENANLTRLCEKSNNTGGGNTESLGKLSRQKQALQRERDNLIEESQKMRADKERAEDYIIELESTSAAAHLMNVTLKQEIQTRQNDISLQERQKEITEKELKNMSSECEEKTLEIRQLQSHLGKKKDENSVLAAHVKDLKTSAERSIKENSEEARVETE